MTYEIYRTPYGQHWVDTAKPISDDPDDGCEGLSDDEVESHMRKLEAQLKEANEHRSCGAMNTSDRYQFCALQTDHGGDHLMVVEVGIQAELERQLSERALDTERLDWLLDGDDSALFASIGWSTYGEVGYIRASSRDDIDLARTPEPSEQEWASGFECDVHGNMGATPELVGAITTKKTCLLCESTSEQTNDLLKRVTAPISHEPSGADDGGKG